MIEKFVNRHWLIVLGVVMILIFASVFEVMDFSMKRDQDLLNRIEQNKETIKFLKSQLICKNL